VVGSARQARGTRLIGWVRSHRLITSLVAVVILGLGLVTAAFWSMGGKPTAGTPGQPTIFSSDSPGVGSPTADSSPSPSPAKPSPSVPTSRPPAPPAAQTGWPNGKNTGVPAGTVLSAYSGCSGGETLITQANTVIDSKRVDCNIVIRATGVVIKNSLIKGNVDLEESQSGSFTITDSEVTAGMGTKNFVARRVNVHNGAGPNVYCYTNCDIRDSWLHSPSYPADNPEAHLGAFLANDNGPDGSTTNVTLIHNTIHCDTPPQGSDGGCSGDVNLFGDFGPITHVTIDGNWLGGSKGISFCFYGGDSSGKGFPHADHVIFRNNVFQKSPTGHCGDYGPVAGFNTSGSGNVWSNNKFDDGTPVAGEM
jgi:hypothetical protein